MLYSNASSTQFNSYDPFGDVTSSQQSTGGQTFPFSNYTYNKLGELTSLTYPSGRQVSTVYDVAGRPTCVYNGASVVPPACPSTVYVGSVSYAPNKQIKNLQLGNALTETTTFDTRFWPTQIQTSNSLLTLGYTYYNNGNVQTHSIFDGTTTRNQSFTYDGANRLSTATETGIWSQTYVYDVYGNRALLSSSNDPSTGVSLLMDVATASTTSVPYDTNNHLTTTGAVYDVRGNLNSVSSASNSFSATFDAENRQIQSVAILNGPSTTVNYSYDGDGRRVTKSVAGGAATTYVYDAQGHLAAEYSTGANPDSGTQYLTADALGSTRLITTGTTTPAFFSRSDYLPFGQEIPTTWGNRNAYAPDTNVTIKFTGKERDSETGLDFFGARYFSGAQGRFTSPDPLLNSAKPWDPQTWNRYTYGLNNPLKYFDPNGLYNLVNNCEDDNTKCNKQFEQNAKNLRQGLADLQKHVDKMKDGAEKDRLQSALYAIGTENDYNNVNVNFGPTGDGSAAVTNPAYNAQANNLDYNVTFDPRRVSFGGTTNGWAVDAAHEGTHIADISDPRYSNQTTTLSPFSLEYRGYQTSSWAASALGMPSLATANGRYEIWNKSWGAVDDKVLTQFLTNMKDLKTGKPNHPETVPHNPWGN